MSTLSTHVLDAALGVPAAGLVVDAVRPRREELAVPATTDADGRVALRPRPRRPAATGWYFDTGAVVRGGRARHVLPRRPADVRASTASEHYHVALLLSPYSYTTYRGS